MNSEGNWDLADVIATEKRSELTVLKKISSKLQGALRCAEVAAPYSMKVADDVAPKCVLAPIASVVFSNDALQRIEKVSELMNRCGV